MSGLKYQLRNFPTYFGTWFFPRGRWFWNVYVYFRWLDDIVDDPNIAGKEKTALLARQRRFLERAFGFGDDVQPASYEEATMWRAIRFFGADPEFQHHIFRLFDTFEFDVRRFGGGRVSRDDFLDYSRRIGGTYAYITAVMMGVSSLPDRFHSEFRRKYGTPVQEALAEYAHCCHLVHVLRDREIDVGSGYDNLPIEYETFDEFAAQTFSYVLRRFKSVEYEHFFLLVKYRVSFWLALVAFCYYARFVAHLTRFHPSAIRSQPPPRFRLSMTVVRFFLNRFYFLDAFDAIDVLDIQHQQVSLEPDRA